MKGMLPMEAFDFIPRAMFEAFKQESNMSSVKRIIRQGQDGLVQIVHLSVKGMGKFQEHLGEEKSFLENLNFEKSLEW